MQVIENIRIKLSQAEGLYPKLLEALYTLQKLRGKPKTHKDLIKVLIRKNEMESLSNIFK